MYEWVFVFWSVTNSNGIWYNKINRLYCYGTIQELIYYVCILTKYDLVFKYRWTIHKNSSSPYLYRWYILGEKASLDFMSVRNLRFYFLPFHLIFFHWSIFHDLHSSLPNCHLFRRYTPPLLTLTKFNLGYDRFFWTWPTIVLNSWSTPHFPFPILVNSWHYSSSQNISFISVWKWNTFPVTV